LHYSLAIATTRRRDATPPTRPHPLDPIALDKKNKRRMQGFSLTALVMAFTASPFAPPSVFVGQSSRVVPAGTASQQQQQQQVPAYLQVASLRRQQSSVALVQTMSLFGLRGPELAIILIAAAFVLVNSIIDHRVFFYKLGRTIDR
jgi:hypothetical protein